MEQDWMQWKTDDVAEWLTSINLPHLIQPFYNLKITGEHLPKIDDNFLVTYLKVTSPAERILFLQLLHTLPNMTTSPISSKPPLAADTEVPPIPTRKKPPPKPNSIMDAQELINSPENLHSGWIKKQGGRIRTWKRRYMVLHQGCLYYFENEKSSKQKGSLALPGYVLSETNEVKEFPNCMKLAHKNPNKRVYMICTSSQREKDRWMEAIQTELDLYKEENLLGQAIYGDSSMRDMPLDEMQTTQMLNERLSDGDNDEEPVSDFDLSPLPNIPSRFITSKDRIPENLRIPPSKSVGSKTEQLNSNHSSHANTLNMRNEITLNSTDTFPNTSNPPHPPLIVSHVSTPHLPLSPISPQAPTITSCPSSPVLGYPPPISKRQPQPQPQPQKTEDDYLVISPNPPANTAPANTLTNGLAQRELPGIPDNKTLPPSRPLPTLPSEQPKLPPNPSLDANMPKRHSTPAVSHASLPHEHNPDSRQSLPLIQKHQDVKSYEDVEGYDDFSQLGATFNTTMKEISSPKTSLTSPTHPLPKRLEDDLCDEAYIAPIMEVLPEGCIQSSFTRDKAEQVLTTINHDGMYLIRDSSEESISMVLTVWCKDRCKHYKVFKHEKGYCLHRGTYFTSLEELVRQYRVIPLPRSAFTLKTPYNVLSSNSRFT